MEGLDREYWVPEHVREWLRSLGFTLPLEDMEPHIWGSLLLNDKTQVACEAQECTNWLASFFSRTGFLASAQECVVRAFGLGTGAWALWVDAGSREVRVRRYDARMVIPLTWDEEGVTECAFVTRAFWRGRAIDQVQLHLKGSDGASFSPANFSPSGRRRVLIAYRMMESRVAIGSSRCASIRTGTGWSPRACARCTRRARSGQPSR